jgi:hypothetical protein
MFLNRYRNLRRLQEVRKVETDFVLARLAGAGCGSRVDCSRKGRKGRKGVRELDLGF